MCQTGGFSSLSVPAALARSSLALAGLSGDEGFQDLGTFFCMGSTQPHGSMWWTGFVVAISYQPQLLTTMAGPRGSDARAGAEGSGISKAMSIVHPRMRGTGRPAVHVVSKGCVRCSLTAPREPVRPCNSHAGSLAQWLPGTPSFRQYHVTPLRKPYYMYVQ